MLRYPARRMLRGFTLVELVIVIVIIGVMLSLGLSSFLETIRNAQLRARAENILSGLQLAKMEALKRNTTVRFQLVDTLDASCALVDTGPHWITSIGSAAGICQTAPDPAGATVLAKSDANANARIVMEAADTGGPASLFCFNSLGQLTTVGGCAAGANARTEINFAWDNPYPAGCRTALGGDGYVCLRVTVSPGGQMRLCDPAVPLVGTDARRCL